MAQEIGCLRQYAGDGRIHLCRGRCARERSVETGGRDSGRRPADHDQMAENAPRDCTAWDEREDERDHAGGRKRANSRPDCSVDRRKPPRGRRRAGAERPA